MKKSILAAVCLVVAGLMFAMPAVAAQTIADYESGVVSPNNLSGVVGGMSGDGAHDPVTTVVTTPVQQGTNAMSLTYTNTAGSTWSGIYQFMNATQTTPFNASGYATLNIWARGAVGGEKFKVELQVGANPAVAVAIDSLTGFSGGLTNGWQEIVIPLSSFTGINLAQLTQLNIVIDTLGTGTVYFDNIRFVEASTGGSGTFNTTLIMANYENGATSPNNLGGAIGGMSPDAHDPTLTVVTTPVQEGGYALSMAYNFSISTSGGWCGMWQQLASDGSGIDVSAYDSFRLFARGISGGELFKIEAKDVAGHSATINIADLTGFSGGLTVNYQEIVIPLSAFTGVDMATLKEINYVCDQAPNNRTIYIDNVRFTGTVTGGQTTVTVTVKNYTVSVEVTGTVSLGQLIVGTTGYSPSAVTVTNNGNVAESFWLSLGNPSGWTSGSAAGANQFVLMGAFDAAGGSTFGWNVANHVLTTSPVKSSATRFAGSQTGQEVAISASRSLWFAFCAPTSTSVETAQVIPVTITASIGQ